MTRTRPVLIIVAALAALLCVAVPAGAATPAEDLAWLNAKRAAAGIPGDVALDSGWSEACAAHVAYMRRNVVVAHEEDPELPGYSAAGDWAGRHSVLASADPWTAERFIWEHAPLHLAQLMAPQLATTGIADDGQLVCVTTLPGYTRQPPARAQVVTYPGNGESVAASEIAEEWPQTPAEALGLPQPTGPNLLAFRWGDASDGDTGVRRVRLDGPAGPVPVRWVDRLHPALGPYLPPDAAVIVPVAPLTRDAHYVAQVEFEDGTTHVWAFSTASGPSAAVIRRTRLVARAAGTRRFCARRVETGCAAWTTRRRVVVKLAGRVTSRATGAPLAGAIVEVRRPDLSVKRTRTGAQGGFSTRLVVYLPNRQRVLGVSAAVPHDAVRSWPVGVRPAR